MLRERARSILALVVVVVGCIASIASEPGYQGVDERFIRVIVPPEGIQRDAFITIDVPAGASATLAVSMAPEDDDDVDKLALDVAQSQSTAPMSGALSGGTSHDVSVALNVTCAAGLARCTHEITLAALVSRTDDEDRNITAFVNISVFAFHTQRGPVEVVLRAPPPRAE